MAVVAANNPPQNYEVNLVIAGPSTMAAFISFKNKTKRKLRLLWIDYNGREDFYHLLDPEKSVNVNTFRTHPWIFRDVFTGERMHVGHQNIYWPQQYMVRDTQNPELWRAVRKQVIIHYPIRTLRDNCLWNVASLLILMRSRQQAWLTLDTMQLPKTLKADLKFVYELILNNRRTLNLPDIPN